MARWNGGWAQPAQERLIAVGVDVDMHMINRIPTVGGEVDSPRPRVRSPHIHHVKSPVIIKAAGGAVAIVAVDHSVAAFG